MGSPMGRFCALKGQGHITDAEKPKFFAEELAEEYGGKEVGAVAVLFAPKGLDVLTTHNNGRSHIEKRASKLGLKIRFEERPNGFVRAHVYGKGERTTNG